MQYREDKCGNNLSVLGFGCMRFQRKQGKIDMALAEQQIMEAMGNFEVATISGNKVTWKTQNGRTTIDSKGLKKDHPDIYEKYKKVGNPIRVFKA